MKQLAGLLLAIGGIAGPLGAQVPTAAVCDRNPGSPECYEAALVAAQVLLRDGVATGIEASASHERVVALLRRGCGEGVGEACYLAGILVSSSQAPSANPDLFRAFAEDSATIWRSDSIATTLYMQGCDARLRSGGACQLAGLAYASGLGRAASDSISVRYYWAGCDAQNATSCYRLGRRDDFVELGPRRLEVSDSLARLACRLGSIAGCNSVTVDLERSAAAMVPGSAAYRRTMQRVREEYIRNCDDGRGSLIACNNAGTAFLRAPVAAGTAGSARHYLELACVGGANPDDATKGYGVGCANLGEAFLEGTVFPADTAMALRYLDMGCALAEPDACAAYATRAFDARRIGLTDAILRAASWCYTDSGYACYITGLLYQEGRDVPRALAFHVRACGLAESRACNLAADIHDRSLADPRGQLKYLRRACRLDNATGCLKLADVLVHDPRSNPPELYATACRAGAVEACWKAAIQFLSTGAEEPAARSRADACRLDASYCKRPLTAAQ